MQCQQSRWYNTPWTTSAFRAFLNFSMLQAAVQVAKLRRETLQCFWPGLVPQGSRDLESAHLVPDPAKRATSFLRPLPATNRFLSALTFSNLTMPTLVLSQVAQLSKNGPSDHLPPKIGSLASWILGDECRCQGLQKLFAALTGISLLQKACGFSGPQLCILNLLPLQVSYSETARFHSSKEHPVA